MQLYKEDWKGIIEQIERDNKRMQHQLAVNEVVLNALKTKEMDSVSNPKLKKK